MMAATLASGQQIHYSEVDVTRPTTHSVTFFFTNRRTLRFPTQRYVSGPTRTAATLMQARTTISRYSPTAPNAYKDSSRQRSVKFSIRVNGTDRGADISTIYAVLDPSCALLNQLANSADHFLALWEKYCRDYLQFLKVRSSGAEKAEHDFLSSPPRFRIYSSDVPSCIMTTPTPSPGHPSLWKRLAIISFFGGLGITVTLAAILGVVVSYSSRLKPPQPWNTNAIVADGPPGFSSSTDGKKMSLSYSLRNTTDTDYHIDSDSTFKLVMKTKDGTFTPPIPADNGSVELPVFIPTKQKAYFQLSLVMSGVPQQTVGESDDAFHERLRSYLEKYPNIDGFAVFEETNRYQINLPRWNSEPINKKVEKSEGSVGKLSSKECAARVRTLYPHAYDDLDDDTLTRRVLAKYPNYCDSKLSLPSFVPDIQSVR